jgi:hypothetical protein
VSKIVDAAAMARATELMNAAREKRRLAASLIADAEQTQALANTFWMTALGRECHA